MHCRARTWYRTYTEVQHDKVTDKTVKLGFTTTSKSKLLVIDQPRSMREQELELNDKTTPKC